MLKFSFLQCQFFSPSRFPIFTTTFVEFITVIYCAYLWVYFESSLFINSYGMAIFFMVLVIRYTYTQFSIKLGNFRILSCLLKLCSCNSILLVISFRLVSSVKFTITYTDFFHALPTIIPVFRVKSFTMLMFVISSIKLPQIRNYLFHVYTLR